MNIGLTEGASLDGIIDDGLAGMLVAPEAEHLIQALRPLTVADIASDRWLTQHGWLERLNMQAHLNASQMRDEFVMEGLVLHEKMGLLVHSLLASELWRCNVYPLLEEKASEADGIRLYQTLYHEGVVANLLEVTLFHRQAAEGCADALLDLLDWCHRRLVWLEAHEPPAELTARTAEEAKASYLAAGPAMHLARQLDSIEMVCALAACSIVRFCLDHSERLPAGVLSRLLDSYDLVMLVARLLEARPWRAKRGTDGAEMRFEAGSWTPVGEAARHRLPKVEAQLWLCLLTLSTDPAVRARYTFTDYRKAALVRLRKYLNETTVDQIPPLAQLQRAIDELALSETPALAPRPAYILEQLPTLRDALARGQDWSAIAAAQLDGAFGSSAERKRAHAEELAALYSNPAVERLLTGPAAGGAAVGADRCWRDGSAALGEHVLVLEFEPAEARDGAGGADEATRLSVRAHGRNPTFQTVFQVEADAAARALPARWGGAVRARASLRLPDGTEVASSADAGGWSQPLRICGAVDSPADGAAKPKAWLQLGHDPNRLRVQVLLARAPAAADLAALAATVGDGKRGAAALSGEACYVVGSVRVTAPERHALRLEFVPETADSDQTVVVVAEGSALAGSAQALFRPTGGTGAVGLPPSCRLRAELRAGERVWRAVETRLELDASRALQWVQVGKGPAALRLQLRLRQAVHGGVKGIELAAAYVTLPDETTSAETGKAKVDAATERVLTPGAERAAASPLAAGGASTGAPPRAKIEEIS